MTKDEIEKAVAHFYEIQERKIGRASCRERV